MIPDLPKGMPTSEVCKFYRQYWGMLSDQSTIHTRWFTHSQNASVCWICDLSNLTSIVLDILESYLSKSTLDIETSFENESDSNSEIEDENYGSQVPEFEVEDELQSEDNQ